MSLAQDSGPYAGIVMRAVRDVTSGDRQTDGPGWDALGIDTAFLEHAARHAVSDDDALQLKWDAVRARVAMLLRGGGDPTILQHVPDGMRREAGRRFAEDRLALMRVRRAFVDRGPPIRPLFMDMLRHAGLDAAVACMVAVANWWKAAIPVKYGIVNMSPLEEDRHNAVPECAVVGEMRVGVPLTPEVRFTTTTDMRTWLIVPPMPQTIAPHLVGRTVGDIVRHPALPSTAPITDVARLGDMSPDDKDVDHLVLRFEWTEEPRTWRGCDPNSFGPIGPS